MYTEVCVCTHCTRVHVQYLCYIFAYPLARHDVNYSAVIGTRPIKSNEIRHDNPLPHADEKAGRKM